VKPTNVSGEIILTNGNSDFLAMSHAIAVFPVPNSPSNRTESKFVFFEFLT